MTEEKTEDEKIAEFLRTEKPADIKEYTGLEYLEEE